MYIIAGLGNPGKQYEHTRHNVGFDTLDKLAEKYHYIEGQKVILVKPQTYMNLSGESLREIIDFYKLNPAEELIVIYDDISLDPGQLRIRAKGSAGGHNGIKSIIAHLGSEFMRVKMGVGEKPAHYDLADYVLGRFPAEEEPTIRTALEQTVKACETILTDSVEAAMNQFNGK